MAEPSRRKQIWGWFFFDWASQPYHTLLVTFVFGPFFAVVATEYFAASGLSEDVADAQAQSLWSLCLAVTGVLIGLGAPLIGALADTAGRRMPWIVGFATMYVLGAIGIWWTLPDGSTMMWALFSFGIGLIGAEYALIFINAQLPSLAGKEEVGELSGSGFAFGYVGGLVALIVALLLFVEKENGLTHAGFKPAFGLLDASEKQGTRAVGPFVALWFIIFMIPYFLWVRDTGPKRKGRGIGDALKLLTQSIKNLRNRTSLLSYLGSSMFYRDALNGLYGFGGTYAVLVLNWSIALVGIFGIIGAVAAAVFSWAGGRLDRQFGPKPVIMGTIFGLILVCFVVVGMDREQIYGLRVEEGSNLPDILFFGCGMLIGGLGGTLQSASRSLMVRHTDPSAPTESFGLYGLSGKATAFMAPALIGMVTALSGNARIGAAPVIVLFLIGLILLRWVKAEGDSETWSGISS